MGQGISLKSEKITPDLNHDLIFYCTHNQLCVPQYKVNVLSTYDIKLCPIVKSQNCLMAS